ncbi:MAG: hypothetical protein WCF96_04915 [Eubacteriales bacterium]
MNKILVYGNTVISKMLFYDALGDNDFTIAAFLVDKEYLDNEKFMGLPQINVDLATSIFNPTEYKIISVLGGYSRVRAREEFFNKTLSTGFEITNYLSKKADISQISEIGVNNIIFAGSHVGLNGKMGNNNLIRQNIYLGHDFIIGSHNVISPGCNIGGMSKIEDLCYIGLGSTIIEHVAIARETLIGAGSLVIRNTEPFSKNVGNPSRVIGYHEREGIQMRVYNE